MARRAGLGLTAVALVAVIAACAPTETDSREAAEPSDAPSSSQEASSEPEASVDRDNGTETRQGAGSADGSPSPGRDLVAQASHLDVGGRALSGGNVALADFVGSPVALWMWAPW